ncbi:MAG TPA: QacE family quaternary ammonium compound efflux SMR transporter [Candidatus Luteococcus avicola]|nr:QacE family quaternary ammonium compound efflux SMR transporter [Candidatus Luteococcus avicola]
MTWLLLSSAIVTEVAATLCLRMVALGRRWFYVPVGAGYVLAFTFLSLALREGLPLGVAYGIWSAVGVALTAIATRVLFQEPLTRLMAFGIALIMLGVLLIELGS